MEEKYREDKKKLKAICYADMKLKWFKDQDFKNTKK